jgi:hypothetical protein
MIVVRECKEEHALVCYGRFVIWCNSGWRAVPNRAWLTDYACTDRPRCGMVASDVDTTRRRGDALVFWAHVHRPATVGPSNHYWIVSSYARVLLSFFKKKTKKVLLVHYCTIGIAKLLVNPSVTIHQHERIHGKRQGVKDGRPGRMHTRIRVMYHATPHELLTAPLVRMQQLVLFC